MGKQQSIASMTQKGRMNRSDSGSSLMSSVLTNGN